MTGSLGRASDPGIQALTQGFAFRGQDSDVDVGIRISKPEFGRGRRVSGVHAKYEDFDARIQASRREAGLRLG
jgi:hypothetical protein